MLKNNFSPFLSYIKDKSHCGKIRSLIEPTLRPIHNESLDTWVPERMSNAITLESRSPPGCRIRRTRFVGRGELSLEVVGACVLIVHLLVCEVYLEEATDVRRLASSLPTSVALTNSSTLPSNILLFVLSSATLPPHLTPTSSRTFRALLAGCPNVLTINLTTSFMRHFSFFRINKQFHIFTFKIYLHKYY